MKLREHLGIVQKYWIANLQITNGNIAATGVIAFVQPPKHRSSAQLDASGCNDGSRSTKVTRDTGFARPIVTNHVVLVTSDLVLVRGVDELGLGETHRKLSQRAIASIPFNNALLETSASNARLKQMTSKADATAANFIDVVKEPRGANSIVTILQANRPMLTSTSSVSSNKSCNLTASLIRCLVHGFPTAMLRKVLDLHIHVPVSPEEAIGTPMLSAFINDRRIVKQPLITRTAPLRRLHQPVRAVHTNLRFLDLEDFPGRNATKLPATDTDNYRLPQVQLLTQNGADRA